MYERPGIWTPYTPTWSTTGTAPSLGNGTLVGAHSITGKRCHLRITLIPGSTTTYGTGGFTFTLPAGITAKTLTGIGQLLPGCAYDASAGVIPSISCLLGSGVTTLFPSHATGAVTATSPFTWVAGDYLAITGEIEID